MKRQLGMTLLEIILVLAAVGIVLTLALRFFVVVNTNLKLTRAVTQIQTLTKASEQWLQAQRQLNYEGAASGSAISTAKLETAGLITAGDTKNPWGGDILISPSSVNPSYVNLTMKDVPQKACFNLISRMKTIAFQQANRNTCIDLGEYFIEL